MKRTELDESTSQWDYTDPTQRILIAERCRAMLDALAANTPQWDATTPEAERGHRVMVFASLTNAGTSVTIALRYMRNPPAQSTATSAHACTACGRHPDTHTNTGDTCGACGLGDSIPPH